MEFVGHLIVFCTRKSEYKANAAHGLDEHVGTYLFSAIVLCCVLTKCLSPASAVVMLVFALEERNIASRKVQ